MTGDGTGGGERAQPLRVLIVEDSLIMQQLLRGLLTDEAGVEVAGVLANAHEAAEQITGSPPDVAIVDIALENSNGFELMKARLAMPEAKRPVVMVLTNFTMPRYRAEAERLGARYFFDKNGEIVDLLKAVGEIAASRQRRHE